ncbi:MAG: TusE/DsrC/DsvC family sulfur relay protein [Pseudomonadales bacterium]|nr:TusE/DsrC/DsvC family sulfur relay protein [Pseudomonadales bacterium]
MNSLLDKHRNTGNDRILPARDKDGYLRNLQDWNEQVAVQLAAAEEITLQPSHWEIILLLRRFHDRYGLSPAMRPLVRYVRMELGSEKGNSLYLLQLFPGNPALIASKIAGLPRPENCF